MDSEYQPISRVERLLAAHPWLLEAQAWKLLSVKYVLMGPELTIHNPDPVSYTHLRAHET